MQCPYCASDSSVTETRISPDGVRRRRVCSNCKRRFTTYEKAGAPGLKVIKRDGASEVFDGEKLWRALRRICRHRPGVRDDDLRRLSRDIEASLVDSGRRSIAWSDIVALALRRLEPIDRISAERLRGNYVDESGDLRLEGATPSEGDAQLGLPGVEEETP